MKRSLASFFILIVAAGNSFAQPAPTPPPQQAPPMPSQAQPQQVSPMPVPGPGQMPTPPQAPPPAPVAAPDAGLSNASGMGSDDSSMVIQPSPEGYTYDPAGRRDPFKPYGQSQQSQVVIPQKEDREEPEKPPMPTDPLQMYDVSQFRLVGIIWQVRNPKAVVRDPVGKMHLIYRETKIGRNSGFVASIREGEVLVVEPTVAENGMPSAITRSMILKR
jgi:type IV pilus assembly protein PilP